MRRSIVVAILMVVGAAAMIPGPVAAGSAEDAALALGAFAVFNQFVRGETVFHGVFGGRETVIVESPPAVIYAPPPPPAVVYYPPPPPVVYAAYPPVVYVPPAPVVYAPAPSPVVVYPFGASSSTYVRHPEYYGYRYEHHRRFKKHDDD